MVPKKHKELIEPTAEKHSCEDSLVDDLVTFYYKELRKAIIEMRAPVIRVEYLGQFRLKYWKLDRSKDLYQKGIAKADLNTFRGMARKKEFELVIEKIDRVKQLVQAELERKKELKDKRNGKIDPEHMEESGTDS